MNQTEALKFYHDEVEKIKADGLFKGERVIASPQSAKITAADGEKMINMCANNYLGLADSKELIDAACECYKNRGFGCASVRFICGTLDIHKELEEKISAFLGTEDTILYSSCFDANGGLFETILTAEDAIISDELNHASIIDGVRLCKAVRYRYHNNDMADLEQKLIEADKNGARIKLIATDGVFSMDGTIANLRGICDLADKYHALVMVDDSHATGFVGAHGKGTAEYCGVMGRVDIITSTFGKALGGASGGFTSGRKEIIALLRQRSRRISSRTHWRLLSRPRRRALSTCFPRRRSCVTAWRRIQNITEGFSPKRNSISSTAFIRLCRSCSMTSAQQARWRAA